MKVTIDFPNPPSEQKIINIPIHFCGGQVVDAGGYGFEEPKTAHWIKQKGIFGFGNAYGCSSCGRLIDTPWEYCPYCGAKMR